MPTKSISKKPRFKSESEGKRQISRTMQSALRKGTIVVAEKVSMREALDLARSGKRVVLKKGVDIKPTDSAILQKLVAEARGSMTQAISLRIPLADLDAAKAIAEKKGLGYQSVLKQAIRDGLRRQG